jgi:hypothetical protein
MMTDRVALLTFFVTESQLPPARSLDDCRLFVSPGPGLLEGGGSS